MTPDRKLEIQRQARIDVTAMKSGWPVRMPKEYSQEEGEYWKQQFDLIVAEGKRQ